MLTGSPAPVFVCTPLGSVNVGPVELGMSLNAMSSKATPYLIWCPLRTLVAFTWYCLLVPSLFSKKPMPPDRICGVTRLSCSLHAFTLGTSLVVFCARAQDASRRNELVITPSYFTTAL